MLTFFPNWLMHYLKQNKIKKKSQHFAINFLKEYFYLLPLFIRLDVELIQIIRRTIRIKVEVTHLLTLLEFVCKISWHSIFVT